MKKLLFLSNGHGEDLVAAALIKKLSSQTEITVMPLVGEGEAFADLGVNIIGPRKSLPSGGFSLRNIWFLAKDLLAGLGSNTFSQIAALKSLRGKIDLTIAIGDIVPIIGALTVKAPFLFVGVNKSNYYKWFGFNYTPWEKQLLASYAKKVFVRDKITQIDLTTRGIKVSSAEYVGNPLMDCIDKMSNVKSCLPAGRCQMSNEGIVIIGLLPGTREDAKINLEDLGKVAEEINRMKKLSIPIKFITATALDNLPVGIEKKSFAEVLSSADLVIGLSGTGNEQAAGSGKPVVSFYGRGSQYNKKFAEAQKQLLGTALDLVRDRNPICVAAEVWQLLRNPEKMAAMGKAGQARMGKPGAIEKIAAYVKE
ncbi:MAG: hypothetical protein QME05_01045 [Candidatus Margulisbacteria bacterium]|nr:hypothetical protein [Candidatus Margulisiibacteriota bacterium]